VYVRASVLRRALLVPDGERRASTSLESLPMGHLASFTDRDALEASRTSLRN
jgi:hypothetical protein